MVNSLSLQEVYDVVEKAKQHFEPILSSKTFGYYTGVWNKLITYAETSADSSNVDLCSFYEKVAHTPAYTKPSTKWWMMQARAVFVLGDLIISAAPKREYTYNQASYAGIFTNEFNKYIAYRIDEGKARETIRKEKLEVANLLTALEDYGITSLKEVTADHLLCYIASINPNYSDAWKRSQAYTARRFLCCPKLNLSFSYDIETLLLGYRHNKKQRLESFYTTAEIKAVMNAVDRDTPWGKTIYAMMLLACIYGLRVSDIRELQLESIHWKEQTIRLYQYKTKRFVELPLTEETTLALLDYIKNVRPNCTDTHVFIRHTRPYMPYSKKDNFGSKVSYYFKKAGVNTEGKHHGLHSMRHSLATNLLGENTAINEIASILGHSSAKSTKRYIWSDIKHLKLCALEVISNGN